MTPRRLVELSHPIRDGMVTLPGLPGPELTVHLTRAASTAVYAPGTSFEIGRISMIANTGTYLDSPHHRFADGADLARLTLEQLVDLPALVVDASGQPGGAIDVPLLEGIDVAGRAVLLRTGDSARFGTAEYVDDASFLTRSGAEWLVAQGVALVGIDSANIDDMSDLERPAHTVLLAAGTPIVEHLTGLEALPAEGARFTAVPPRVEGFGTFPVRAFAVVPG
jgi:kynurenine formamidase